jgi:hypothetical protein
LDLCDAGIIDHNVEAAEVLFGTVDGGVDVVTLRHIGFERRRLATDGPDLISNGFHLIFIDVHNRQDHQRVLHCGARWLRHAWRLFGDKVRRPRFDTGGSEGIRP